jgi:hypothetical protein
VERFVTAYLHCVEFSKAAAPSVARTARRSTEDHATNLVVFGHLDPRIPPPPHILSDRMGGQVGKAPGARARVLNSMLCQMNQPRNRIDILDPCIVTIPSFISKRTYMRSDFLRFDLGV